MSRASFDEIRAAARGRWLDVLTEIIGGEFLTGKNTPCPGCGGRDRFQFNRKSEAGAFSCRGHDDGGGDGFALLMHVLGCDFKRAAELVAQALGLSSGGGEYPPINRPAVPPAPAVDWLKAKGKASRMWHEAKQITATDPAGLYLRRRGLKLPTHVDALRFHPALPYWTHGDNDQPEFIGRPPAMLARIQRPDGMGAGLHRIYLEPDGRKFDHQGLPAKKIFKAGDLTGCAVRLGRPADSLAIAEGIETALAFQQMTKMTTWAALSSSLMPTVWVPDHVTKVYIARDNDEAGHRAAQRLAERLHIEGKEAFYCDPLEGCNDWADYLLWRIRHAA